MDFMRGASLSRGGKPILALPSTAARGTASRITLALRPGAGVVTTRGHVHWVVTEYGAVNLHGLSVARRVEALISLAHLDFRQELRRQASAHRVLGASSSLLPDAEQARLALSGRRRLAPPPLRLSWPD